jgi:hypothetical protein
MCTVTFIPRHRQGYSLGMNRDEQLSRVHASPPKIHTIRGRAVLFPFEPGGGTWIALNEMGACFALINWYSITARVKGSPVSRGQVVRSVSFAISLNDVESSLHRLPLDQINPFRLIGIFPGSGRIAEWRWDLRELLRQDHGWRSQQWVSSGFDESTAQNVRGRTFLEAQRQRSIGSLNWLRRLHVSHAPECGPFSTCMHRADAATVSYTEVTVSKSRATLSYYAGAPCRNSCAAAARLTFP